MDKKELEKKVAGLLNVSEEFQKLAFAQFKKKLSEFLKVGEAVKINSLGVFQMKEQLDRSDDLGKINSKDKSLTLVFSPESRTSEDDSIFLNLELDEKQLDDNEFDENVFQIGIDKPLVTSEGNETESNSIKNDIAITISTLIDNSEKIKNFDLWEDHLKNKETKDILDELGEDIDNNLDLSEPKDKLNEVEEALYEKDFVEMDENEIFDEIIEKSDLMTENDLSEIIQEDDEITEHEDPQLLDDLEKVTEDFSADHEDSFNEGKGVIEEIDELIEEEKPKEKFMDEIDLELKEENFGESDDINEDKIEEQIIDNPEVIKEEFGKPEIESELNNIKDIEKGPSDFNPPENKEVKYSAEKKRKSSLIYLLIALFFIVAAIGIYYIFFNKPGSQLYEQEASIAENVEEIPANSEENLSGTNNGSELAQSTNVSAKIEDENEKIENRKDETELNQLTTLDDEKEVAESIYFDGFVYNVQISSWRQRSVADRESQKLINKGFPAFIIKVYIPKFDGDWHRVRIGPYPSIKAAKQAQQELNK